MKTKSLTKLINLLNILNLETVEKSRKGDLQIQMALLEENASVTKRHKYKNVLKAKILTPSFHPILERKDSVIHNI